MDYIIKTDSDKGIVARAIYALPHSEKPWLVKIKLQNPTRSINQNGYYWGVVIELTAAALGYEPAAMHKAWAWELLEHEEIIGIGGRKIEIAKSTADLTTVEMEAYLTAIRMKASEMGIFIPLPNETI